MKTITYERIDLTGIATFVVLVLLLAAGCSQQAPPTVDLVRPVKTTVVAAGGESHVRSFPGTVEASRRVELAFQVPGLLGNGITRVEVAQALESSFEGRVVGFYREPGYAAAGVFPQETRLLPIVARPPLAEREDVSVINSLQIWSPVAGRMIPMNQVTSGAEVVWEDPIVHRRNRFPTLTVHADPRSGLPSELFNRVRSQIEEIELRPVCMVVITTVLGMIPLLKDPFFGAMAVCLMFGLSFAALLCLIVTPVLYAILFKIHEPQRARTGGAPQSAV